MRLINLFVFAIESWFPDNASMNNKKSPATSSVTRVKSTGPTSAEGKAISSQNALIHGATSQKLINDNEQGSYEVWVTELTQTYPSSNPLMAMQIQRVAQLKVQLDRIQASISGLYEIERMKSSKLMRAADTLELSNNDKSKLAWTLSEQYSQPLAAVAEDQEGFLEVARELVEVPNLESFKTHEEFETKTPVFCHHLRLMAHKLEEDIDSYVCSRKISEPPSPSIKGTTQTPYGPTTIRLLYGKSQKEPKKDDVKDVAVADLIAAAKWYLLQFWELDQRQERLKNILKVADIAEQTTLPDLDTLDRLMRYQTTINRQLSTAMCELLALAKTR